MTDKLVGDLIHADQLEYGDMYMIDWHDMVHIHCKEVAFNSEPYLVLGLRHGMPATIYRRLSTEYQDNLVYLGNINDIYDAIIKDTGGYSEWCARRSYK